MKKKFILILIFTAIDPILSNSILNDRMISLVNQGIDATFQSKFDTATLYVKLLR